MIQCNGKLLTKVIKVVNLSMAVTPFILKEFQPVKQLQNTLFFWMKMQHSGSGRMHPVKLRYNINGNLTFEYLQDISIEWKGCHICRHDGALVTGLLHDWPNRDGHGRICCTNSLRMS